MYLCDKLFKTASEVNTYPSSVLFAVARFCINQYKKKYWWQLNGNMLHKGGKIHNDEE